MRAPRGTKGDYRHYPPEYIQAGEGCTVDRSDPVHPIVNINDQGGITEVQGSDHVNVDSSDPKKPIISTTGLIESVVGSDHIEIDSTDPLNPVVSTKNTVYDVNFAQNNSISKTIASGVIEFNNTPNNLVMFLSGNQTVNGDSTYVSINFDTTRHSINSSTYFSYSSTDGAVLFHKNGLYCVQVKLFCDSNVNDKNGGLFIYGVSSSGFYVGSSYTVFTKHSGSYKVIEVTVYVVVTDESVSHSMNIRLRNTTSGETLVLVGGKDYYTSLNVVKLR